MSPRRGALVCLAAVVGIGGCGNRTGSLGGVSNAASGGEPGNAGNGGSAGSPPEASVGTGGNGGSSEAGGGRGGAGSGGAPGATSGGGAGASSGGTQGMGGTTPGAGGSAGALASSGGMAGTAGAPGLGGTPGNGGAIASSGGATTSSGGTAGAAGAPGLGGAPGNGGAIASSGGATGLGGAPGSAGVSGGGGIPGGGGSSAERVRPHILFIFDNSASMQENASGTWVGESTNICNGPNSNTSRIYGLKAALRAVLGDLGTQANVGLMSFPIQSRTPPAYSMTNWCLSASGQSGPVGHYAPTPAKANRNIGCDISSHDSETTFGDWFTSGVGEVIRTGVTSAPPGTMPMAANYDPIDGNVPAVQSWIDDLELPTTPTAPTNPELHGMNYTPLGRSLFYARLYFDNFVRPVDPRAACRLNMVVMVTDGDETCDTAAPDATFDATTCAGGGSSFSSFDPVYQACRLRLDSGIKTYVITDSGLTSLELASNDRIASAGGTAAAARVSLADSSAAKTAIQSAITGAIPPTGACSIP